MQTMNDARNYQYAFTYDSLGRLTRDEDPAGGVKTLSLDADGIALTTKVDATTNRVTRFNAQVLGDGSQPETTIHPDGTQSTLLHEASGRTVTAGADGTITSVVPGPDPRFGMQARIAAETIVATPYGRRQHTRKQRSAVLTDGSDPLSLATQTDLVSVNDRLTTTIFDATTLTQTTISPMGRETLTVLDDQGMVIEKQIPGLATLSTTYDAQGRSDTSIRGSGPNARTTSYAYDTDGFLASITDPAERVTSFVRDEVGRVTQQTLPDGRTIGFQYDANGNLESLTPPGRPAHGFEHTAIDLMSEYVPPNVDPPLNEPRTLYSYNLDKQLTQIARPDGSVVSVDYDTAGRMSAQILPSPQGQVSYTYDEDSGQLSTITAPASNALSFAYDGILLLSETWSGDVSGSVSRTYDDDFRGVTQSVNGGNTITMAYDDDGLLIGVGELGISRDPDNGLISGSTLGNVIDARTYNEFGEVETYVASYAATSLYSLAYQRDMLGRITHKTETITGSAPAEAYYRYDLAGRLYRVCEDEACTTIRSEYHYDQNGNRIACEPAPNDTECTFTATHGALLSADYDAQDRLLSTQHLWSPAIKDAVVNHEARCESGRWR